MDILKELWPYIVVFGSITLVEIAPIKINPWSKFFRWIGNAMLGEFKKEMQDFKADQEERNAVDMRWKIIDFANSCRRGEKHSKDAWRHCLDQIAKYEKYTEDHGIVNGVIDADSEYLHTVYIERNKKNDFI